MNRNNFVHVGNDSVDCYFFSLSSVQSENYWNNLQSSIQHDIEKHSCNYIWHKEKYTVYLPLESHESRDLPTHLRSSVIIGDNIEDEWFIVHLLLEITTTHKDLIVQVNDDDGDFLLIESADVLPAWITPDNSENRVYIHQGQVYIITPTMISLDRKITIQDAINTIREMANETCGSKEIQDIIKHRIGNYPEKQLANMHKAVVEIPLEMAAILSVDPSMISAFVDEYCNHDILDVKLSKHVEVNATIITTVTFTKCLYAMLIHAKPVNNKIRSNNTKMVDLGVKLTTSYKLLMNKLSNEVIFSNEWYKFLDNLKTNGYFKGNLDGSKEYCKLLETAKQYFISHESSANHVFVNELKKIMQSDKYKQEIEVLKKESPPLIDECDDWLNIHPNQLEDLLNYRYGKNTKFQSREVITPQTVTNQLSNFLKEPSDFEGIETNKRPPGEDAIDDTNINFDPDLFQDALKRILGFASEDDDDDIDSYMDMDVGDVLLDTKNSLMEKELKSSLLGMNNEDSSNQDKTAFMNLTQSIKEEGSTSGPSSILLKNIGIHKTEILDSDDDEE